MKKIMVLLTVVGLVFVAGIVFANDYVTKTNDPTSDPDSLINYLDPGNAPAAKVPHRGLMGLTESGLPGSGGWAAGGMGENPDSLIHTLDPDNAPIAKVRGSQPARMTPDNPDSLIYMLCPSEKMNQAF